MTENDNLQNGGQAFPSSNASVSGPHASDTPANAAGDSRYQGSSPQAGGFYGGQPNAAQLPPGVSAAHPGYPRASYAYPAQTPGAASATGWRGQMPPSGNGAPQPAYASPATQTQATSAPGSEPKKRGWIVALVAVIAVFVLGLVSIASCTSVMTGSMSSLSGLSGDDSSWAAEVSGDTVGIINISGTIQYDGTTCSPEGLKKQLDAAERNDDIKAVVLRVDSGGGTATAGEEMAEYVRDFSKPVVVSSASMNASAAYEISSQADYIFTAKTTSIGSIGTIMQVYDLSELYEKLGISIDNIASADSKDSSYGNRPLTDEERAYYQAMVDQVNQVFIENVAAGRSMEVADVEKLATGLSFTGIDAVDNGLADEIGTLEDAVEKACELAGISSSADTVYLQEDSTNISELLDIMGKEDEDRLVEALKELESRVGQN